MDKEGQIQSVVLCEQFPQVESFVQYFTYYQSLSCTTPFEVSDLRDLRDAVSDAFLGAAILAWYHVFAYSNSQIFWSKLIKNMPEKVKQNFKNRIYKATSLDKKTYKMFRDNIKTLRDKYVAHRDLNWQNHVPHGLCLDDALKIAREYENWVNDMLLKENSPPMNSLTDTISSAKGEVKHVTELLSPQKGRVKSKKN